MILIYQNDILFKTKYYIPIIGTDIIKRTRIFKKLDSFYKYKLILLTASAGYGKTTLIVSWKNHFSNIQKKQAEPLICWLNVDEKDNDENLFYCCLFGAFYNHSFIPVKIRETAIQVLEECTSLHYEHVIYFINDVVRVNQETIIVIDNFESITNESIFEKFKFLMEYMPSNLHIILSGRAIPQIDFAKQKIYGEVLDINETELAFTYKETENFCNQMLELEYSSFRIKDIYRKTEGWPAGIRIIVLSIKDIRDRRCFNTWLTENKAICTEQKNQIFYDYLMEEVFCGLKEEYKTFLIYTSIPEHFTVSLCNYLLETANGEHYIREIKRKRIFLYYMDEYTECYRYHTMFREFLQKQFSLQKEIIQLNLYKKLVVWYEKEKQWNEAVTYAIKGKEYKKAVNLIEEISDELGCRGEAHILHRWNKLLPFEFVEKNPRLLLNSAWAALSDARRENVQVYLKKLSTLQITSEMKNELVAIYSSNLSPFDSNLDSILQDCKKVINSLPEDAFITQLLYFNVGIIYLFQGNLIDSRIFFEKCSKSSIESGKIYLSIVANQAIIRYQIQQGQVIDAERRSISLLMQIEEQEKIIISAKGLLYAALGEIYLIQYKQKEALHMALKGLEHGRFGKDNWVIGENLLILAKIYKLREQEKELEDVLKELEDCVKGRDFFDLEVKVGLFIIEKQIEEEKIESAHQWFSCKKYMNYENLLLIYPSIYLLKAKLAIKEFQFDLAEKYLNSYKKFILKSGLPSRIKECIELEDFLKEESKRYVHEKNVKQYILSIREKEILRLIKQGSTNAEIAKELFISVNTVKTHILSIFEKLEVHNRMKAVTMAEQMNLL